MHFDTDEQALVADLLRAVTSPDLMQLDNNPNTADLRSIADTPVIESLTDWLLNHDHRQPLAELIQQRQPRRLGIYYEVLWQYVLENFPGFYLVARNLPIMRDNRTLGELDFIYYCQQRKRHIHLETAVKFYLGVPEPLLPSSTLQPALSWSQWIGLGCRDRLDLKLLKMLNQQTRLATTEEGAATLKTLGVDEPLREICLKGYFFYPLGKACPPPQHSHRQHARGFWLPQQDINLLQDKTNRWHIMKKEEWLAPFTSTGEPLTLNNLENEITLRLANNPFPIMVANMEPSAKGYREIDRYFITPDHWPYD